jgi:hypothetical protein
VRRIVSSPRKRRLLVRSVALVVVVGGIVGVSLWLSGIEQPEKRPEASVGPALTVKEEPSVRLTASLRAEAETVITRFVQTAVLRRELAVAWELASPALQKTTSYDSWLRGDLPGVFPVSPSQYQATDIRLVVAHAKDALFNVIVIPKPSAPIGAITASVRLARIGDRWLVDSWGTSGMLPGANSRTEGPRPTSSTVSATTESPISIKGKLSPLWFLVPAAIFALIVFVPLTIFAGNRTRERRASRRWDRENPRL